jgi:hypothetical protein
VWCIELADNDALRPAGRRSRASRSAKAEMGGVALPLGGQAYAIGRDWLDRRERTSENPPC